MAATVYIKSIVEKTKYFYMDKSVNDFKFLLFHMLCSTHVSSSGDFEWLNLISVVVLVAKIVLMGC